MIILIFYFIMENSISSQYFPFIQSLFHFHLALGIVYPINSRHPRTSNTLSLDECRNIDSYVFPFYYISYENQLVTCINIIYRE